MGINTVPFRSLLSISLTPGEQLGKREALLIRLGASHRYCIEARNCGRGHSKVEARDHTNRHEEIRVVAPNTIAIVAPTERPAR
jgi:hypothetical protein